MSLRKRDRDTEGDDAERESKREKRRRQRAAARRQKALADAERKRRAEREKAERRGTPAEPEKPAEKPRAKQPRSEEPKAEKKPKRVRPPKRAARGFSERAGRARGGARKVGGGVLAVVVEVLKLGREMLLIPLQLWLAVAEFAGGIVLAVWSRAVLPVLRLVWRALRALGRFGQRHVTPARALALVSLVAIGALVAAQWRDYSAISVGTDAYAGDVGSVAPPPEVSSAATHEAHGWVMLIIAALAVFVAASAILRRRPRLAIWLVPLGIAVIVIALAVDAPKGLDEGSAAVAYESASATLLSGFWLQVAAGVVLVACGLMLPRALRPVPAPVGEPGPSLFESTVKRSRAHLERRRARPKRRRRLPRRLRRPATKGKVQRA